MMRSLLIRGMIAGLVAGLLSFVFARVFGEPAVGAAIAFEDRLTAAAGEEGGVELVSRGVQSTIGLAVALLLYGAAIGGILALVYAAVYGRVARLGPRATAGLVALVGFLAVVLVPFVKYPANPPASSSHETIGLRTGLYVLLVALSIALAVGAVLAARRLTVRFGWWNAVLIATGVYIVLVGLVGFLLPAMDETPADFPGTVLYDFRVASLGGQIVLWATLGIVFGALAEGSGARRSRSVGRPARTTPGPAV
jgi:predicted cobalt transporter CbtA